MKYPRKISTWIGIIGIIITFGVGAFVGPFMQAWFAESLSTRPAVHFMEKKCAIVPLGGTNYIFCKVTFRNDGKEAATPLSLHIEVPAPYVVGEENKTFADFEMGGIRAEQTLFASFKVVNTFAIVDHGSLTVKVRIESPNSWDEYEFSDSW